MTEIDAARVVIDKNTGETAHRFNMTALVNKDTKIKIKESDYFTIFRGPYEKATMIPDPKDLPNTITRMYR